MSAPITSDLLTAVADRAGQMELTESSLGHLRREWPDVHFTFCSDEDVPVRLTPALAGSGFNLYLVSNAEHCIAFTKELEAASGIVLATVEAD